MICLDLLVTGVAVLSLGCGANAVPMRMSNHAMPPPVFDDSEAVPPQPAEVIPGRTTESSSMEFNQAIDWSVWWPEFFMDSMAYQCSGTGADQLRPAISFFACLETEPSGSLFRFFASTGSNLTAARMQLLARSRAISFEELPAGKSPDSATSMYTGPSGLAALVLRVALHANDLCLNTDALMDCMDPYLQACFPDPALDVSTETPSTTTPGNSSTLDDQWLSALAFFVDMFNTNSTQNTNMATVISQPQAATPSETTTPETPSGTPEDTASQTSSPNSTDVIVEEVDIILFVPESNTTDSSSTPVTDEISPSTDGTLVEVVFSDKKKDNDEAPRGFFGLPYLTSADKISGFLRRELQILCESNSDTAGAATLPLRDVLSSAPCLLSQKVPAPCRLEDFQNDDAILNKAYVKCLLDDVREQCSANGADAMQALVDEYLEDATSARETIPEYSSTESSVLTSSTARTNSSEDSDSENGRLPPSVPLL